MFIIVQNLILNVFDVQHIHNKIYFFGVCVCGGGVMYSFYVWALLQNYYFLEAVAAQRKSNKWD
jgi:hypothetical protein